MRIVVDTNVLVSGLLSPHGPPGRIVDGLLSGELVPVFDERILREYALVKDRPRFRFDPAHVAAVLEQVERTGQHVDAPALPIALPDDADRAFLEVAWHGAVIALVTGNARHFPADCCGSVCVEPPSAFVERWARARPR